MSSASSLGDRGTVSQQAVLRVDYNPAAMSRWTDANGVHLSIQRQSHPSHGKSGISRDVDLHVRFTPRPRPTAPRRPRSHNVAESTCEVQTETKDGDIPSPFAELCLPLPADRNE
jgi:hypothetical protein